MNFKLRSITMTLLIGLTLASCEKSLVESNVSATQGVEAEELRQQPSDKFTEGIAWYQEMKTRQANTRNGAQFIEVFFNEEGFWFFEDGKSAYFYSELDGNDFYRENPDGTISVHVTSNQGWGEYDGPEGYAYGDKMHVNMKYTGPVVDFGFFKYIDMLSSPNAVVWHGSGKVRFDGVGPKHNFHAQYTLTPGSGNENLDISLN